MSVNFAEWLTAQRWFGGRTRTLTGVHTTLSVPLDDDLDLVLLDANYADGLAERYQVLVRWDDDAARYPAAATIGTDGRRTAYDGLHDPAAARYVLELIAKGAEVGPLRFDAEPGAHLPLDAPPRVMGVEQSNTSVVFGDAAIFKAFRRATPGINPDIELNRELARADNPHVARLLGAYGADLDGEAYALGMVTEFAAGSTEGWDMATACTRALADGAAEDFASESHRLGAAVASVHHSLAATLGTSRSRFPADALVARLHAVAASVPVLAPYLGAAERRYRALAETEVDVHRIHGDLHLGQVLRNAQRWLVIDFEGEPGQPLSERRRPDSPLRDVAGMLRSYEYAAYQPLVERGGDPGEQGEFAALARTWVDRNVAAFCTGYGETTGDDPRHTADVLAAYELDKAVYEVGYESRYRPAWLPIPLASVARLVA